MALDLDALDPRRHGRETPYGNPFSVPDDQLVELLEQREHWIETAFDLRAQFVRYQAVAEAARKALSGSFGDWPWLSNGLREAVAELDRVEET